MCWLNHWIVRIRNDKDKTKPLSRTVQCAHGKSSVNWTVLLSRSNHKISHEMNYPLVSHCIKVIPWINKPTTMGHIAFILLFSILRLLCKWRRKQFLFSFFLFYFPFKLRLDIMEFSFTLRIPGRRYVQWLQFAHIYIIEIYLFYH